MKKIALSVLFLFLSSCGNIATQDTGTSPDENRFIAGGLPVANGDADASYTVKIINGAGYCTGIIVSYHHVLTKASCIGGTPAVTVGFGVDGQSNLVQAEKQIVHSHYPYDKERFDVALVQLPLSFRLPAGSAPIALAEATAKYRRPSRPDLAIPVSVVGYGSRGPGDPGGKLYAKDTTINGFKAYPETAYLPNAGVRYGDHGAPVVFNSRGRKILLAMVNKNELNVTAANEIYPIIQWIQSNTAHGATTVPINYDIWDSKVFSWRFYVHRNPDLLEVGINTAALAHQHWHDWGLPEGRQGGVDFWAIEYIDRYPFVGDAYGSDREAALNHYILWGLGYKMKGTLSTDPKVFDHEYYTARYPDLEQWALDRDLAAAHFLVHGIYEGRKSARNFSNSEYFLLNPDLKTPLNNDLVAAVRHYVLYGDRERRVASWTNHPEVFTLSYLHLNPTIEFSPRTPSGLVAHWDRYGINDGLRGSYGFAVRAYLEANPDLKEIYKDDYRAAIYHYVFYGRREGRPKQPTY